MGSLEIFKTLQADLGYHIEFRQSGSLTAIHNEEQYDYALRLVQSARARRARRGVADPQRGAGH